MQITDAAISFWLREQWFVSFRRLVWLNKITRKEHSCALWEPRAHALWAIWSGTGGEQIWHCQPHIGGSLTPNPFYLRRKLSFLIYSDLKNPPFDVDKVLFRGFQHATLILLSTQMKSGFGRFLIYCDPSTFNKKRRILTKTSHQFTQVTNLADSPPSTLRSDRLLVTWFNRLNVLVPHWHILRLSLSLLFVWRLGKVGDLAISDHCLCVWSFEGLRFKDRGKNLERSENDSWRTLGDSSLHCNIQEMGWPAGVCGYVRGSKGRWWGPVFL